jgi:hypothetical protein
VLIYTFVEWGQAIKNQVAPPAGYITTETWACSIFKNGGDHNAKLVCEELRAARYLLIPEVVCGVILLTLVVWTRVQMGKKMEMITEVGEIQMQVGRV